MTVKAEETLLDFTPTSSAQNWTRHRIPHSRKGSTQHPTRILLNWNQQRPPSLNLFKQTLNETLRLEQRSSVLENKGTSS